MTNLTGARRVKSAFWRSQGPGGGRGFTDGHGQHGRHAAVHVARAALQSNRDLRASGRVGARRRPLHLDCGRFPVCGKQPGSGSRGHHVRRRAPLSRLVPDVPDALTEILVDALAKSPARRIGSARELGRRLAPFAMANDLIVVANANDVAGRPRSCPSGGEHSSRAFGSRRERVDRHSVKLPLVVRATRSRSRTNYVEYPISGSYIRARRQRCRSVASSFTVASSVCECADLSATQPSTRPPPRTRYSWRSAPSY